MIINLAIIILFISLISKVDAWKHNFVTVYRFIFYFYHFYEEAPVSKTECENNEDQVLQHTALFARMANSALS